MVTPEFVFRAFFKPNQLSELSGLDPGLDEDGRGMGYTQAYHKTDTENIPFRVASEFVSAKIGQLLGLPIPPCAIAYFGPKKDRLFSSLDFNFERARLAPILPDLAVETMPLVCAGVLVFDIFIGNEDRHDENVTVDRIENPRRIHVFDHDQALLSGGTYSGIEKLQHLTNELGTTGKNPVGGNRNVFIDEIKSADHLDHWIDRIEKIPAFVIEDLCGFCRTEIEIEKATVAALEKFLIDRRNRIGDLIRANRDEFTSVDWQGTLFAEKDE